MFWKKRINSKEFKELDERILDIARKITILEIDLSLVTHRLSTAITKKVIKKEELKETSGSGNVNNPVILPE